ncbi:MAG: hypothetical protein APF78_09595 [Sphingomonadales bacterium BRH_c3]|nr:MAG: hypothetical protein APF78_09595 [Sphingomonadales bacterium BRH_c3]
MGRVIYIAAALLAALAALAALLLIAPGNAQTEGAAIKPACHANSDLARNFADMAARDAGWNCSNSNWQANQPVSWLRFDATGWRADQLPQNFFTRISRHKSIAIAAIDTDGTIREKHWNEADGRALANGPVFELALPEIRPDTQHVLVRIELPHSLPLLTKARLTATAGQSHWSQRDVIILAILCGMLILPLFFDVNFYIVLREKFVLVHAAMVVAMINYVLFAGGLISAFVQLPVAVISVAGIFAWILGVCCSILFLLTYLEKSAQSPLMRFLSKAFVIWTLLVPGFFALQLHSTQAFDDQGYFYSITATLVFIAIALAEALLRGSRGARFVTLAWLPIMVASIERLMRGLGSHVGSPSLELLLFIAIGFEVIVISLAVAERFFVIKRERDIALSRADALGELTERDPLTGLLNRRAIDARFADLHAAGYDTFALIDLDHFKRVNDTAGHSTGDRVLQIVAEVLNDDKASIAIRMGGEEFLLLMRGDDAELRLEQLRKQIPIRVAHALPQLEGLVTASVGMIVAPRRALPKAEFSLLYNHADRLLYDAKSRGRNRIACEKLRGFERRTGDRRRAQQRRATAA